uniref:Uncharacterized protein n=1 Tax=Oryza rufipogon TaxID=4529 RepID=A0A0E0PNE3_ORYRU
MLLDPNPRTRITVLGLLETPWIRKTAPVPRPSADPAPTPVDTHGNAGDDKDEPQVRDAGGGKRRGRVAGGARYGPHHAHARDEERRARVFAIPPSNQEAFTVTVHAVHTTHLSQSSTFSTHI